MSLKVSAIALLRRDCGALHVRAALPIVVDAVLDLRTEVPDQALDRPRSSITKRADRVAFHLRSDVEQRVDFRGLALALRHALEHAPHPAGAFAARRALATALVLVEVRDTGDRLHDVGRL